MTLAHQQPVFLFIQNVKSFRLFFPFFSSCYGCASPFLQQVFDHHLNAIICNRNCTGWNVFQLNIEFSFQMLKQTNNSRLSPFFGGNQILLSKKQLAALLWVPQDYRGRACFLLALEFHQKNSS